MASFGISGTNINATYLINNKQQSVSIPIPKSLTPGERTIFIANQKEIINRIDRTTNITNKTGIDLINRQLDRTKSRIESLRGQPVFETITVEQPGKQVFSFQEKLKDILTPGKRSGVLTHQEQRKRKLQEQFRKNLRVPLIPTARKPISTKDIFKAVSTGKVLILTKQTVVATKTMFDKIVNKIVKVTASSKSSVINSIVNNNIKLINKFGKSFGREAKSKEKQIKILERVLDSKFISIKKIDSKNKNVTFTLTTLGNKQLSKSEKVLSTIVQTGKLAFELKMWSIGLKAGGFVFKKLLSKPAGVTFKWLAGSKGVKISRRTLKRLDALAFRIINGKSYRDVRNELRALIPRSKPLVTELLNKGKFIKSGGKQFIEVKPFKNEILAFELVERTSKGPIKNKIARMEFKQSVMRIGVKKNGKITEIIIGRNSGTRFFKFGKGVTDDVMSVYGGKKQFITRAEKQLAQKKLQEKFIGISKSKILTPTQTKIQKVVKKIDPDDLIKKSNVIKRITIEKLDKNVVSLAKVKKELSIIRKNLKAGRNINKSFRDQLLRNQIRLRNDIAFNKELLTKLNKRIKLAKKIKKTPKQVINLGRELRAIKELERDIPDNIITRIKKPLKKIQRLELEKGTKLVKETKYGNIFIDRFMVNNHGLAGTERELVKIAKNPGKLNKFKKKIFNRLKRTKGFKLFEKKHGLLKVRKGLEKAELKKLKTLQNRLALIKDRIKIKDNKIIKLLKSKKPNKKLLNDLKNDLRLLEVNKKINETNIKLFKKLGKESKLKPLKKRLTKVIRKGKKVVKKVRKKITPKKTIKLKPDTKLIRKVTNRKLKLEYNLVDNQKDLMKIIRQLSKTRNKRFRKELMKKRDNIINTLKDHRLRLNKVKKQLKQVKKPRLRLGKGKKIKKGPKFVESSKKFDVVFIQKKFLKTELQKKKFFLIPNKGLPKSLAQKERDRILKKGIERVNREEKRKVLEAINKARAKKFENVFTGTATKVKVKSKIITPKEQRQLINSVFGQGVTATQGVYDSTFRVYSLIYPAGSRVGLINTFNVSQSKKGNFKQIISNPQISKRLIKFAQTQVVKKKVLRKLKVNQKLLSRIKAQAITQGLSQARARKLNVRVLKKIGVRKLQKVLIGTHIITTDLTDITPIIPRIPRPPKIPLIITGKTKKRKPKRRSRKKKKTRKLKKKPTTRVFKQVLRGEQFFKEDEPKKKKGKKKKRKLSKKQRKARARKRKSSKKKTKRKTTMRKKRKR